jgi:general secretion pathway protein L
MARHRRGAGRLAALTARPALLETSRAFIHRPLALQFAWKSEIELIGLLREFWIWWLGQLAELFAGARREAGTGRRTALVLAPDLSIQPGPPAMTARIEKRGRVERLGRIVLDGDGLRTLKHAADGQGRGMETRIEMPAGAMLEKRLVLPQAVERDLDRVLGYEIDRETPFTSDEIYWGCAVEQRDRGHRRITVRLAMVAKIQLSDLATGLARIGLAPSILIGTGHDGTRTVIPISHDQPRRRGWLGIAVPAAAWLCAVLAVLAIGAPFLIQGRALGAIDEKIETLRPTVTAVERLRDRIAGDRQEAESLAAQRLRYGNPLKMLAAVTAALPDDTHLTELDYAAGKIVLSGMSKAAAHLIADISRSSSLLDPAFSAPVTRLDQNGADVFSISAQEKH